MFTEEEMFNNAVDIFFNAEVKRKCNVGAISPRQIPAAVPFTYRKTSMLGVTCGVLLWADMNAATPGGGGAL